MKRVVKRVDLRGTGRGVFATGRDAVSSWLADGGPQHGASIAYYAIFAIAPLVLVLVSVTGLVFGPEAARGHVFGQIADVVGEAQAAAIEQLLAAANAKEDQGWLAASIGLATALVGATAVLIALRNAFDVIFRPPGTPPAERAAPNAAETVRTGAVASGATGAPKRRFVSRRAIASARGAAGSLLLPRLLAAVMVLGLGLLLSLSVLASTVITAVGAWIGKIVPWLVPLMALSDVLLSTIVLAVAFWALIRFLPERRPGTRAAWMGAVTGALLFAVGKHLIGLYLARGAVASAYGAAGSLVAVIVWIYYSAQILLLGAEVARVVDQRTRLQVAGPKA